MSFSIGILVKVFNSDNTRAFSVSSLAYTGDIVIRGQAPAVFPEEYLTKNPFDSSAVVKGHYFIKPGGETALVFELKNKINVKMTNKKYPPLIDFNVKWFLQIYKQGVLEIFGKSGTFSVSASEVISKTQWDIRREV